MKIICEYCKHSIDIDKNDKCPNCQASYYDNKEFKDRVKELKEEKRLELESLELQNQTTKMVLNQTNRVFNSNKYVIIGIAILIMIPILFAGIQIYSSRQLVKNIFESDTPKAKKVIVNMDQYAEAEEFRVKIDKVLNVKYLNNVLSPSKGKKYRAFHLIVENKTNKTITLPFRISCTYEGYVQKEVYDLLNYPSLPTSLAGNLKAEGYILFEVPKDANEFFIVYSDSIIIHVKE